MKYDIVIIGGGIIGLSIAYKLSLTRPGLKVAVAEKENSVAQHQTGHNSGVIHSGLYYKPNSLKAKTCINGYKQLLDFCDQYGIPYEICGKIVVATHESELNTLHMLAERGNENGLTGLKILSQTELADHEKYVRGIKGMYVPQTGIIDFMKIALKLEEIIREKGFDIYFDYHVIDIQKRGREVIIKTNRGELKTKLVIACAGLHSDIIAKMTHEYINFRIIPFRGEYFKLKKEKEYLVKNLIYPVPDPDFPFLGVHFTRMINGGIEAGPNAVLALAKEGYRKSNVNLGDLQSTLTWPGFIKVARKYWRTGITEMYRSYSKKAFTHALQRLLPDLRKEDMVPGGSGVRAQACSRNGELIDDFLFLENEWAVNVCNAPSPAATSSLAIGDYVTQKILNHIDR